MEDFMAKDNSNTETHMGVDEKIKAGYTRGSMNEGFSAASGIRPETASSGGKITHPEQMDRARNTGRVENHIEEDDNVS